jgi:hypothetical protein
VAIFLTIALWAVRRRFRREDTLGILTAMSVTLIPAHDYDIVVLVPLLIAYWKHLAGRPGEAAAALGLATIVLILLAWLIRLSTRIPENADAQNDLGAVPTELPSS